MQEVTEVSSRPMRADAARNRARVLEAAEEIFASEGLAVPIDAIAERAGVGVGTLYRHFPTKEALLEAILVNRLAGLVDAAKRCGEGADAGDALFTFLQDFARQAVAKHDLVDALGAAGIDIKTRCAASFDELLAGVEELRARAVASGVIRDDVSAEEMVGLVAGACHTYDHQVGDEARMQRMVSIICAGLRPLAPS